MCVCVCVCVWPAHTTHREPHLSVCGEGGMCKTLQLALHSIVCGGGVAATSTFCWSFWWLSHLSPLTLTCCTCALLSLSWILR